jgi:hypothetical protein
VSRNEQVYTRTLYPLTSGTTFTVTYLINGDTYDFYVAAINAGGEGPGSNTVSARPLPPMPVTPSHLTAVVPTELTCQCDPGTSFANTVDLSWDDGLYGPPDYVYMHEILYWVWLKDTTANGNWFTLPLPVLGTSTQLVVQYLQAFHTYQFAIQAVNVAGTSGWSNIATAIPWAPTYGYRPYSPPHKGDWQDFSPAFWAKTTDCPTPPFPIIDGNTCIMFVQFESRGIEFYFAVSDGGIYTYSFRAASALKRTIVCEPGLADPLTPGIVGCLPWSDWTYDDYSSCAPGLASTSYGFVTGCFEGIPFGY